MSVSRKEAADKVVKIAPSSSALADLPPPDTRRWVPRRKAEVVAAVERGVLTAEEACERYNLSVEEFESWKKLVRQYGQKGLRVTRLQKYQGRQLRRSAEVMS